VLTWLPCLRQLTVHGPPSQCIDMLRVVVAATSATTRETLQVLRVRMLPGTEITVGDATVVLNCVDRLPSGATSFEFPLGRVSGAVRGMLGVLRAKWY